MATIEYLKSKTPQVYGPALLAQSPHVRGSRCFFSWGHEIWGLGFCEEREVPQGAKGSVVTKLPSLACLSQGRFKGHPEAGGAVERAPASDREVGALTTLLPSLLPPPSVSGPSSTVGRHFPFPVCLLGIEKQMRQVTSGALRAC